MQTAPETRVFHDGNLHYLADGFHRTLAAMRVGVKELQGDVRPGTQQDALWFALGANREHGKRLSSADKRHAILLALKTWPEKSGRLIAEQIGCSAMWVSKVKEESGVNRFTPDAKVTGKDGKSYPASRGMGGVMRPTPLHLRTCLDLRTNAVYIHLVHSDLLRYLIDAQPTREADRG